MRILFIFASTCFVLLINSTAAYERPPAAPGEQAAVDAILATGGDGYADDQGRIISVELDSEQCTDAIVSILRGLQQLKVVSLERSAITDESLKTLATCPSLTRIELGNTVVTDEGIKHLAVLKQLEFVSLDGTGVSDRGIAALGELPRLWGLNLTGTRVGDEGIAHFPLQFPHLEVIRLSKRQLQSFSIQMQVDDQQRSRLEATPNKILKNADTPMITDRSLAVLAKLPKLRSIAIEDSAITDNGLWHLAEKTSITGLDLSRTKVTDAGLAHLAKLAELDWLTLEQTAVTDDGLRHLFGMKKLESIYVDQTAVTEDGAAKLRAAVPGIRNIFGYKILRPRDVKAEEAIAKEKESILVKLCDGDLSTFEAGLKKFPDLFQARLDYSGKGDSPTEFHHGARPLHIAVLRDDIQMVQRLLELGATVDVKVSYLNPPLFSAKSAAMVDLLVKHGDPVEPKASETSSALFHATNVEVAKALIRHGADVHRIGNYGRTALHLAVRRGAFDVVKLLVGHGADVNAHNKYVVVQGNGKIHRNCAETPLRLAAENGELEIAKYLIARGAKCDFDDAPDFRPLDWAVERLDVQWVRLLIDHGAKVIRDEQPGELLFSAAHNPQGGEMIPLLLAAGLRVNEQRPIDGPAPSRNPFREQEIDTRGWTVLHFAAHEGNVAAVKALLAGGADPEIRGVNGWTARRCTDLTEEFAFNPWIQGTASMVREFNNVRKRELDQRNEGREEIRKLLSAARPKSGD